VSAVLAVDVGQSGARLKLAEDGATLHEWSVAPGRADDEPHAVLGALASEVAAALDSHHLPTPQVLSAGMTGFHDVVRGAEEALRSYRPLGVERVVLATDAVTSYLGAVGLVPGVVVAAGTGTIVLGSDGNGRCERIDGWGATLGDDGSGYAIGRAGLRAVYRCLDGRGGCNLLREAAERRYGSLADLPRRLARTADAAPLVAGFSEDLAQAARDGDPIATAIWRQAGKDLADSAAAAAVRVFGDVTSARACTISWAGSLFRAGPLLVEPFQAQLAEHGLPPAEPPKANGLQGALLLADDGVARLFPKAADVASAAHGQNDVRPTNRSRR
jgi:N-acetylglucosamine kinase-like BadF-type ATPase